MQQHACVKTTACRPQPKVLTDAQTILSEFQLGKNEGDRNRAHTPQSPLFYRYFLRNHANFCNIVRRPLIDQILSIELDEPHMSKIPLRDFWRH